MSTQNEFVIPEQFVEQEPGGAAAEAARPAKKAFVEPEISFPVDVLEATTFFNVLTSKIGIP
ncbi:MAG TPA: hypothetical protein VG148_00335 [Pyrinomonadaceae bacterium]|nr:hypothetical protein [Pyrinomonadaceae bacterium]